MSVLRYCRVKYPINQSMIRYAVININYVELLVFRLRAFHRHRTRQKTEATSGANNRKAKYNLSAEIRRVLVYHCFAVQCLTFVKRCWQMTRK